jgi:hypothetical protein
VLTPKEFGLFTMSESLLVSEPEIITKGGPDFRAVRVVRLGTRDFHARVN